MENIPARTEAAPIDANEIARAQLLRFRRRLGALTHDQELQIEELVISTVMKISLVTEKVMEALAKNSASMGRSKRVGASASFFQGVARSSRFL
jgi:hypothetical protein